jgi:hypothetical protein
MSRKLPNAMPSFDHPFYRLAKLCLLLVVAIFLRIALKLCYFPLQQENELVQASKWLTGTVFGN